MNLAHHLNLVEIDSQTAWVNLLLFRNYLREHPDTRESYDKLKQELAAKHPNDRVKYTEAKSEFVLDIIRKASAE